MPDFAPRPLSTSLGGRTPEHEANVSTSTFRDLTLTSAEVAGTTLQRAALYTARIVKGAAGLVVGRIEPYMDDREEKVPRLATTSSREATKSVRHGDLKATRIFDAIDLFIDRIKGLGK